MVGDARAASALGCGGLGCPLENQPATMRRDKRKQSIDFHRPAGLRENIADQCLVNVTQHHHPVVDEVMERARCEIDHQRLLVDLRFETDIVEVLVERVELMSHLLIGSLRPQYDSAQKVPMQLGVLHPTSELRARLFGTGGMEDVPRSSTPARVLAAADHKPLGLQHTKVISQSVLMQTSLLRELSETLPRRPEKLMHDAKPTGLGQPTVGVGTAWHVTIIPAPTSGARSTPVCAHAPSPEQIRPRVDIVGHASTDGETLQVESFADNSHPCAPRPAKQLEGVPQCGGGYHR